MMLGRYGRDNKHKRIKKQRRYKRLAATSQLLNAKFRQKDIEVVIWHMDRNAAVVKA